MRDAGWVVLGGALLSLIAVPLVVAVLVTSWVAARVDQERGR